MAKRKLKKAIAIIGEGQTEQFYFNSFKKHDKNYAIKIKPELSQHSDVYKFFKQIEKYKV